MTTGSGAGIDASKCCKRGGMCACGGGICGAETRQYSGVREFIPPADDLVSMMTKTCEQCGITGLHICGSASVNSYPKTDTGYSAIIEELEKSLAASEKDLEGARRGLRMMTGERDALAANLSVQSQCIPMNEPLTDEQVDNLSAILDAYESGVGHGLKDD